MATTGNNRRGERGAMGGEDKDGEEEVEDEGRRERGGRGADRIGPDTFGQSSVPVARILPDSGARRLRARPSMGGGEGGRGRVSP